MKDESYTKIRDICQGWKDVKFTFGVARRHIMDELRDEKIDRYMAGEILLAYWVHGSIGEAFRMLNFLSEQQIEHPIEFGILRGNRYLERKNDKNFRFPEQFSDTDKK